MKRPLVGRVRSSRSAGGVEGGVMFSFIVGAIVGVGVLFMAGCDIDDELAELLAAHGRKGNEFVRPDGLP